MAVMFSLGLSLTLDNFVNVFRIWKAVGTGLLGQLILLPVLGCIVVIVFALPPPLAIGLLILAISPGGITSNALVFSAGGNVALSVVLTSITSLVTVVSTPIFISFALDFFIIEGTAPDFSVVDTIMRLFRMTVMPVVLGMVARHFFPLVADRLVRWLKPATLIVLASIIGFSIYVSAETVWASFISAGPPVFALNVTALVLGFFLARIFRLNDQDTITIGIEVGVQNATVATFLTLAVLNDIVLAVVPTMYGVIMLINSYLFVQLWRSERLGRIAGRIHSTLT